MIKVYTMEDLPMLKEKNNYLTDAVMDMIEIGVKHGDYDEGFLKDEESINIYLLEEINSGFIKIFNEIN